MSSKHVAAYCALLTILSAITINAQTLDTWSGASGGEWNNGANWSTTAPPLDPTTNAFIGTGITVNYNLPMSAASFGVLTNNGILNINTNGFNCTAIFDNVIGGGEKLFMNTGAVVTVNSFTLGTNTYATLSPGASLTVNGALTLAANETTSANNTSTFTNNGGYLSAQSTTVNNSSGTGTGLLLINGGTNYLGNTAVGRNHSGAGGATLGTEGLVINNGLVIMTNLNLGNAGNGASSLSAYITGGIVTNFGSIFINQGSSARFSRLLQTAGLFVVPDPGVVNPNPTVSGSLNNYTIFGGTNFVGGFYFGNSNNTSGGTINFTNGATIYVGSQGIASNGVILLNALLNNGGMFGATADWTGSTAMKLNSGTFTFQAADLAGTPHNIIWTGDLTGSGNLNKTGAGTLAFNSLQEYTGNTIIGSGTLALGANGYINSSPNIIVGSGATFDVTALNGTTATGAGQTLAGFGTVAGGITTGGIINPGSNTVTGTLTFTGGLNEIGTINRFFLSINPSSASNDLINVVGDFSASGICPVQINGTLASSGIYKIVQYTGNYIGWGLQLSGANGSLSNSTAAKAIYYLAPSTLRNPTNIVWVGNSANNVWDTQTTTNWLNNGTLDFFISGDNARFDTTGAANTNVNITASVIPGSVTVDSTANYSFTGNGSIDGIGGLTKTNSGTLTIFTTNNFSGATTISGGTLEAIFITNSLQASSIGAAGADPSGLVLTNGGTLRYIGSLPAATDRGITFAGSGSVGVTNGTTLTLNGSIIGTGLLTKSDNGELVLNSGNANSGGVTIASGTLTLENFAGAGTGTITASNGTTLRIIGALTVGNQFNAAAGNVTVDMTGAGGNTALDGAWSGAGTVNLTNMENSSRTFTMGGNGSGGGGMNNFSGTVQCGTIPGSVRFNDGGGNGNTGSTNMTLDLGSSTATLLARNGGITLNIGALWGSSTTTVSGRASGSSGTLTYSIGGLNNNCEFDGLIKDGNNATALTKVGNGTLTLEGQNSYTGNTTVSAGTIALAFNPTNGADANINSSATINVASGAVLDVSGRSDDTLQVGSSVAQLLEGRGTIRGSLNVNGSGTVAPGGGPGGGTGILTVTNSVTLSGSAWMKLNRTNSVTCDQIASSLSTITYGGTLTVTNIGPRLQAGDTFTLFSGAGLSSGSFGQINLPNYYTWDTSNLGVNGAIQVTAVLPAPKISSVDFSTLSSGTITLNAANGVANGPVIVLTTTNISLPLSSWTGVTTNNFDSNGNLNLSITVNPAQPQSFYLLEAY